MIDSFDEAAKQGQARKVAELAADWIQRRQFWDWSETDQAELDAWLGDHPLHLVTYLRLEAAWSRTERLTALSRPLSATPRIVRTNGRQVLLARIAAAVLIAAAGVATLSELPKANENSYVTPIGVHEAITLSDGSQIELNTDSALRTRADGNRRVAFLDRGEAYFKIKHDNAHPFVVYAGDHKITDIGTKFSVRERGASIEISVLEGRTRLDSAGSRSVVLNAGDTAVASAQGVILTKKPEQEIANALAWQRGMLVFSRTPLSEVAAEINRYNTRKLVVADATAANARIGGTFPTTGVEEVTAAAKLLFGLHVEDHGTEIVISR